jgi:hypothetical protein
MSTHHGIDLSTLNRSQLQQLLADAQQQLSDREAEDRAVLETRCKSVAAELKFDETAVRVAGNGTRAARKPRRSGGADE